MIVIIKYKWIFAMLWIIKQKRNKIKLIGSCPCLKKRFFGIKMLRYRTFFFDIEHISSIIKLRNQIFSISKRKKRLKMLKTDRKQNKNVQK